MPFGPRLVGDRVTLREGMAEDVGARQRLGHDAGIQRMFGAERPRSGRMSPAAARAWIGALGGAAAMEWVVEAEGSFLGTARLHSFADMSARYAIGLLDPERLGRGYGSEATVLVLPHAYDVLRLDEVTLAVLELNERAIRCYEKCGFGRVGRIDGAAVIEGRRFDDIVMAIRSDEFRRTRSDRAV
jgi:RimJ/RimL family protein N-acetyltransferase